MLQQQIIDGKFPENQANDLTKLFEILEHYFHYEGFNFNKIIKRNYVFFDPDKTAEEKEAYHATPDLPAFTENLDTVLTRGNYNELDHQIIEDALANDDLIGLQLKINFDYFSIFFFCSISRSIFKNSNIIFFKFFI